MKEVSKEFQSSAWGTPYCEGAVRSRKSRERGQREKLQEEAKNGDRGEKKNEDSIRASQAGASQISIIKRPRNQSQ